MFGFSVYGLPLTLKLLYMNLKRTIESLRQVITFARYALVITLLGGIFHRSGAEHCEG